MRLYPFSTGTIKCPNHGIKLNQFDDQLLKIPVPWYLLVHEKGNVIIDGGNPQIVALDPVEHWGDMIAGCVVEMTPQQACVPTLRSHGFRTEDVRHIVQTHLHADHVGAVAAIEEFRNAVVHVDPREHDYARAPDWHLAADYVKDDFTNPRIAWRWVDEFPYDLFGDGSVILHSTPGHTVGHFSVEVTLPRSGSVLLTGDAAYTQDHWEDKALPGIVASTVDAVASVRQLRALAKANDSRVIFGHDITQWETLPREGAFFA